MLSSISKAQLYISASLSVTLFLLLTLGIEPTTVFGLVEFLQLQTGYFFGVGTGTVDYCLISSIPIMGVLLSAKRKTVTLMTMVKYNLIILCCCFVTFGLGLCLLITEIGSPGENPLIPKYLRAEPFTGYSSLMIALGIALPLILFERGLHETEDGIEEIGGARV